MIEIESDKLHEECGVVAVYGHAESAKLCYWDCTRCSIGGRSRPGLRPAMATA